MLTSWGGTAAMHWWSRGVVGVSRLSDPGTGQPPPPALTTPTKRFGALGVWPGGRGQVPVAKAGAARNSVELGAIWRTLGGRPHVVGFSSKGN